MNAGASESKYQVALSFAGEDRHYVEAVAVALRKKGLRVFYDSFEKTSLWGKNLYDHLSDIYSTQSNFTVVFISKHYARKAWTNHERRAAQAKAFKENADCLLPARFDDTPISGIPDTTSYVSLIDLKPEEFAELIIAKIKGEQYILDSANAVGARNEQPPSVIHTTASKSAWTNWLSLFLITLTLIALNYFSAIDKFSPETGSEKLVILFSVIVFNSLIVYLVVFFLKIAHSAYTRRRRRK